MGTIFLDQIKRQASSYLQEKYNTARMLMADVTEAELLSEDVTKSDVCSPDAKSMTRIAEASYDADDFWRIVDVIRRRLYNVNVNWKQWRVSYNALVLLDFLLTHGPACFAEEFVSDAYVIQNLGAFKHKDQRGFDWGAAMKKKAERIVQLLQGGDTLRQARLKALRITNEIQGFGNSMMSPTSTSSSSGSSSASSFGSYSSSSPAWTEADDLMNKLELTRRPTKEAMDYYSEEGTLQDEEEKKPNHNINVVKERPHVWDNGDDEVNDSLLLGGEVSEEEEEEEKREKNYGVVSEICSKLVASGPSRFGGEKIAFRSV